MEGLWRDLIAVDPLIAVLPVVFEVGEPMATVSLNYFESDRYYIRKDLEDTLHLQTYAYMCGYSSIEEMYGVSYKTG